MNKKLSVILTLVFLSACKRETADAPCLPVPESFLVNIHQKPDDMNSQFFTDNYRRCKKRNLKKNENALFSVGVSVLYGLGTNADPMKAFLWFKGASELGNKRAHLALAQMFEHGIGVVQNSSIAKKHLEAGNERF